jgi:hypothetical protein
MDLLHNPQGSPCVKAPESSTEPSPGKCVGSGELYKNTARFFKNLARIWDLSVHLCCATVACDASAMAVYCPVRSNYSRNSTLILQKKNMSVLKNFLDAKYLSNLAYLCNLFEKLNVLNLSLQGSNMHVLKLTEKVSAFRKKSYCYGEKTMNEDGGRDCCCSLLHPVKLIWPMNLNLFLKSTYRTSLNGLKNTFQKIWRSLHESKTPSWLRPHLNLPLQKNKIFLICFVTSL